MKANVVANKIIKRIFKPKEKLKPSVWCERNVNLSKRVSDDTGRFDLDRTPYMRKIYDALADPRIRKIVLMKSAQVGASLLFANAILYFVSNETYNMLYVSPSTKKAKEFKQIKLDPMLSRCIPAKRMLPNDEDFIRNEYIEFQSGQLHLVGAGSPANLASISVPICLIDEADKLQQEYETKGETDSISLAEQRTANYPLSKKILIASTPTTKDGSKILKEYQKGSQHKYHLRCPHCEKQFVLRFDMLKGAENCKREDKTYDLDKVAQYAHCECPNCKGKIYEKDKAKMVLEGEWIATSENYSKETLSFHISRLYSLKIPWWHLIRDYLVAKDDPIKLHDFYNGHLGEPWEERAQTTKESDVTSFLALSPKYQRNTLPVVPSMILMACDTQDESFWYTITAITKDFKAYVLDYGQVSVEEELVRLSNQVYEHDGKKYGIDKAIIDSGGHRILAVLDLCLATGEFFMPCRGVTGQFFTHKIESDKLHKGVYINRFVVGDYLYKNKLFTTLIKVKDFSSMALYFPEGSIIDPILIRHLMSEKKVTIKGETKWVEVYKDNHVADCLKYTICFFDFYSPLIRLDSIKGTPEEVTEQTQETSAPEVYYPSNSW